MKKLIVLALLAVFVMPLAAAQVFAADETVPAGIVDAGNKMCPVMGGPVNGKDFVVYEGKRYGLCCPGCEKTFLSDPAKYSARIEVKAKTPASAVKVTPIDPESAEMQRDMEQRDF
jgi:YHS domain-containing protein